VSYLSDLRDQRRQDKWTDAQIELARDEAKAQRRRDDEAAKEQKRTARKYARKVTWKTFRDRLPDHGMAALWATMIVLPITVAWQAQARFAHIVLHIPEPLHHVFPASIELAAWLCAFEAHRRRRRRESAGLMPTYMWSLAGVAALINGAHGLTESGVAAALGLAAMSMLGIVLHSARQGLDAARVSGNAHVRLALWRRARYPRLSLAATSLRAARDGLTAVQAWHEAWVDRFGVGPDASRRERRLARRALRAAVREDRKAVRAGDVTVVDGKVQKGFARVVREHVDRERAASLTQALAIQQGAQDALNAAALLFGPDAFGPGFGPDETGANPAGEQGSKQLSKRALELLPALDEAIQHGVVRPNPSVKAIEKWVRNDLRERIGTPDAMELRDRVRGLHAVPTDEAVTESDSKEVVA
jgi:hypothetical protein